MPDLDQADNGQRKSPTGPPGVNGHNIVQTSVAELATACSLYDGSSAVARPFHTRRRLNAAFQKSPAELVTTHHPTGRFAPPALCPGARQSSRLNRRLTPSASDALRLARRAPRIREHMQ